MCRYSGDILTPHFGNAFVWHFILFGLFLVTTLCDRQYYSHCTDEALEALKVYFLIFFFPPKFIQQNDGARICRTSDSRSKVLCSSLGFLLSNFVFFQGMEANLRGTSSWLITKYHFFQ